MSVMGLVLGRRSDEFLDLKATPISSLLTRGDFSYSEIRNFDQSSLLSFRIGGDDGDVKLDQIVLA
jgi:hypothetical protein